MDTIIGSIVIMVIKFAILGKISTISSAPRHVAAAAPAA
jgi:hypothetical protein